MSGMDRDGEPTDPASTPWTRDAGPEPEWAEAIRQGRKVRADRLRAVFASFGEDDRASAGDWSDGDEGP